MGDRTSILLSHQPSPSYKPTTMNQADVALSEAVKKGDSAGIKQALQANQSTYELNYAGDSTKGWQEHANYIIDSSGAAGATTNSSAAAKTDVQTLISANYLGDPDNQPELAEGGQWRSVGDVQLYPEAGQPSPNDVNQHQIGDCGVVATLASWAQHDPGAVQSAIRQTGVGEDGTPNYAVRMYDPSGAPVDINVDGKFAADADGNAIQTVSADEKANWATVAEKAYAKYRDIYGAPNNDPPPGNMEGLTGKIASIPSDPMQAFTGKMGDSLEASDPDLLAKLQTSLGSGELAVASSSQDFITGRVQYPSGHAYTIQSVDLQNQTITMRNPWGVGGGGKDTKGVFTMSASDFVAHFGYLNITNSTDVSSQAKAA